MSQIANIDSSANEASQQTDSKISEVSWERKRKFSVSDELARNIIKHSKKESSAGYVDAKFDETDYYVENGLRKVYPYYFTYTTFCKGRWVGKPLLDVFGEEFRAFTREQYKQSITLGNLMVNGCKVTPEYILKDNDNISNKIHRHEVGVLGRPVSIVHLSDELLVVDKPSSIPVHPCGRYRHNSLLFILAKEHGLKGLHTIHRLDRLTSGIILCPRTLKKSQELDELVREYKVDKTYVARVEGKFPDGTVFCNEPIDILSPKIGVCHVKSTGKKCSTAFERLSYNGKSSVVKCKPLTGRMHQIRVHLQYLGHPIVNDPIYNHEDAFGPMKGKGGETGKCETKLLSDLMEIHNIDKWLKVEGSTADSEMLRSAKDSSINVNEVLHKLIMQNQNSDTYMEFASKYKKDENMFVVDPSCCMCTNKYRDPEPRDLVLFLHALCYKIGGYEFKTELPVWANNNWAEM